MADKKKFDKIVNIKNKKASFQFEFIDTFKAGIMLKGTEIKSIREGKVSLTESFCVFFGWGAFCQANAHRPLLHGF